MGDKNTWNVAAPFLLIVAVTLSGVMMASAEGNNSPAQTGTSGPAATATGSQALPIDQGSIGAILISSGASGHGVKLGYVVKGGPADRAGLIAGDLITAVDGIQVNKPEELVKNIASSNPGTTIAISYLHKGKAKQTSAIVRGRSDVFGKDADAYDKEAAASIRALAEGGDVDAQFSLAELDRKGKAADATTYPHPPAMSLWQARQTIMEAARYMAIPKYGLGGGVLLRADPSSLRFPTSGFEFDGVGPEGGRTHFKMDLSTLESNVKGIWYWSVFLEDDGGKPLKRFEDKVKEFKVKPKGRPPQYLRGLFVSESKAATVLGALVWANPGSSGIQCVGDCANAEASFFPAVNRLRAFAIETETAASEFRQQAAAWRALSSKSPLPEGVRVQRLLAEDAVKNKRLQEALSRYEMGLELYPTWPQGWFNAALISGELGSYADAADDMQTYLELVPDAKDAQSARDQIAMWREKAKEHN